VCNDIFWHVMERIRLDLPLHRWPPRSPDMTPCDFFLSCYMKDAVFMPTLPTDIDDLKRHITEAVAAVTCDMLRRVWEELDNRFDTAASNVWLTASSCEVWK
jgi:hypothetical protein